ncbi:MAG: tRNA pseudouridine(55) synthase TruB [Candidatus Aminicenantes bacterium]|nr:tRNA pseudouridine(55) synthase TruB [Candidatus Aminicenantes bacterium]
MDGLLLVDKPPGPTSHDVVARLRRALGRPKTGHFGTLDPMATGLLIVAVGQATRLNQYYAGREKSYRAVARLGTATDTYDAEGAPRPGPAAGPIPDRDAVDRALLPLRGEIEQVPPPYSAKKIAGTPLYRLARAGQPVSPRPARVIIHDLRVLRFEPPDLELDIRCSTGTYIRSLAHDLGQSLGCGAHLTSLRRTAVGEFRVEQASALSLWDGDAPDVAGLPFWVPLEQLLPEWPRFDLDEADARAVRDGRSLPPDRAMATPAPSEAGPVGPDGEALIRLFDAGGRLAALARRDPGTSRLAPFLVFPAA